MGKVSLLSGLITLDTKTRILQYDILNNKYSLSLMHKIALPYCNLCTSAKKKMYLRLGALSVD